MGKSFDPIGLAGGMRDAELLNSTPRPIVSMSFQLAIPWRVALPQSPPPLHQPGTIMQQRAAAGHQKPANGQQCLNYLSHPRGQAQTASGSVGYVPATSKGGASVGRANLPRATSTSPSHILCADSSVGSVVRPLKDKSHPRWKPRATRCKIAEHPHHKLSVWKHKSTGTYARGAREKRLIQA